MTHRTTDEIASSGEMADNFASSPLDRLLESYDEEENYTGTAAEIILDEKAATAAQQIYSLPPTSSPADYLPSTTTAASAAAAVDEGSVNPLFWAINASAVLLIVLVILCVCRRRGDVWVNEWIAARSPGGSLSDLFYARGVVQRRREEEESKKETPEKRKERLLARFAERGVRMVVRDSDFVGKPKVVTSMAAAATAAAGNGTVAVASPVTVEAGGACGALAVTVGDDEPVKSPCDGIDIETGQVAEKENSNNCDSEDGEFRNEDRGVAVIQENTATTPVEEGGEYGSVGPDLANESFDTAAAPPAIALPAVSASGQSAARPPHTVPNCCAVCLCPYEIDDALVFSSNPECLHAFHEECIVEWLVKMQAGTPCPCCRQEFVDLPNDEGSRRKKDPMSDDDHLRTVAFDLNRISWV